jgi:hypothetical protein
VVLELVCNASLCKLFPDQSYVKEIHWFIRGTAMAHHI